MTGSKLAWIRKRAGARRGVLIHGLALRRRLSRRARSLIGSRRVHRVLRLNV